MVKRGAVSLDVTTTPGKAKQRMMDDKSQAKTEKKSAPSLPSWAREFDNADVLSSGEEERLIDASMQDDGCDAEASHTTEEADNRVDRYFEYMSMHEELLQPAVNIRRYKTKSQGIPRSVSSTLEHAASARGTSPYVFLVFFHAAFLWHF